MRCTVAATANIPGPQTGAMTVFDLDSLTLVPGPLIDDLKAVKP